MSAAESSQPLKPCDPCLRAAGGDLAFRLARGKHECTNCGATWLEVPECEEFSPLVALAELAGTVRLQRSVPGGDSLVLEQSGPVVTLSIVTPIGRSRGVIGSGASIGEAVTEAATWCASLGDAIRKFGGRF